MSIIHVINQTIIIIHVYSHIICPIKKKKTTVDRFRLSDGDHLIGAFLAHQTVGIHLALVRVSEIRSTLRYEW